jgi:3-hydroxyisobutyrate dehydrogenase-like beta-hydroxyacid dehydrogenase
MRLACSRVFGFATKVGFVGLGNMGMPMAVNLSKKGFEVSAFDIDTKK